MRFDEFSKNIQSNMLVRIWFYSSNIVVVRWNGSFRIEIFNPHSLLYCIFDPCRNCGKRQSNNIKMSSEDTSSSTSSTSSTSTTTTPKSSISEGSISTRVEVKHWQAISLWSWDIEVDTCAICRNLIMVCTTFCYFNLHNQYKFYYLYD
jgi:hypothetical protein